MPVLRRGLRRGACSPPTPGLGLVRAETPPGVGPPPGPVAPHEE